MKTKSLIVIVVVISAITLVLSAKESSAQNQKSDSDWSYTISGDPMITYTLTKTRYGKITHEIIINYDNNLKKIVAVKEDGVVIQPTQFASYLHYIESSKKTVEGARSDTENLLADLDEMHTKILKHQLQMREVLQNMVTKLESSGYQVKNKSFRVEYKNNWCLNFSDKIYLDNKLLPEALTQELLTISKNLKFDSKDSTSLPNLADGLDEAILSIDKEIRQIKPDIFDTK